MVCVNSSKATSIVKQMEYFWKFDYTSSNEILLNLIL